MWPASDPASTPHEGGEGLELVGDEAARRRIGQFAGRGVDLGLDLRDDDLRPVEGARVELDEHLAQVMLGAQTPP